MAIGKQINYYGIFLLMIVLVSFVGSNSTTRLYSDAEIKVIDDSIDYYQRNTFLNYDLAKERLKNKISK